MNGLDLFSGIGGISYALSDWVKPVAYCEIEPYCQSVLLQRMRERHLPQAPIWDDVRTLPANELPPIDIITAGFPCQDISIAGNGKGLDGEHSGLFFEIIKLASLLRPSFMFLENVPAILHRGGKQVVGELAKHGYDCRWTVISASSVGALHQRKRWFALCHTNDKPSQQAYPKTEAKHKSQNSRRGYTGLYRPFTSRSHWQKSVADVCRAADGIPNGMDRLATLGNAVVPQQVQVAFISLLEHSKLETK